MRFLGTAAGKLAVLGAAAALAAVAIVHGAHRAPPRAPAPVNVPLGGSPPPAQPPPAQGAQALAPWEQQARSELEGYKKEMAQGNADAHAKHFGGAALSLAWQRLNPGPGMDPPSDAWGGWFWLDVFYQGAGVTEAAQGGPYEAYDDSLKYLEERLNNHVLDDGNLTDIRAMMADWRKRRDRFFELVDQVADQWCLMQLDADKGNKMPGTPENQAAHDALAADGAAHRKEGDRLTRLLPEIYNPPVASLRKRIETVEGSGTATAVPVEPGP